jgi:glycogen operon protein
VSRLRKDHPTFRRARFFDGRPVRRGEGEPLPDIVWITTEGDEMQPEDWDSGFGRVIGVFLNGQGIRGRDARGQHIVDEHFLLYFSGHDGAVDCRLPSAEFAPGWQVIIDTAGQIADDRLIEPGGAMQLSAKSMIVLRAASEPSVEPDHSVAASVAISTMPVATGPVDPDDGG